MGMNFISLLDSGWHPTEDFNGLQYVWSTPIAQIRVPEFNDGDLIVLDYAGPPSGATPDVMCFIEGPGGSSATYLGEGRGKLLIDPVSLNVQPNDKVRIQVSKPFRPEGDGRDLGLMLFDIFVAAPELANQLRRDNGIREMPLVADYTPSELTISVSDKCNLRCVTCFAHHHQEGDNNARMLDFPDEFIPKIRDAAMGASRIQIHGGAGEPMMAKNFWDWFSLLEANPTAKIEFNTNGLLLNEKNIEKLLRYNVDHISVSCDAATPETYADIRGGDFQRLLNNIKSLIHQKVAAKNPIKVLFNMTITATNVADAPKLVQLAHDIGVDGVELYHLNSGNAFDWVVHKNGKEFNYRRNLPENNVELMRPYIEKAQSLAAALKVYLFVDPRFQVTLYGRSDSSTESLPEIKDCRAPWHWMVFETNGGVKPCCMAAKDIGNLQSHTALDIWNGKLMQRLRQNIKNNKLDPICAGGSCRYIMKEVNMTLDIDSLKVELDRMKAAYAAEKARADEIVNSRSWKLTQPLRSLSALVQKLKKVLIG